MTTVGVITGKFAPLHNGHIYAINKAATQVDKLYVVLSYDQKFVDNLPLQLRDKLTLNKRLLWLKKTFSNLSHINIVYVDESNMGVYPNGVEEWTSAVEDLIPEKVNTWFSSEPEYTWWVEKYFKCKHVLIDSERSNINIAATKIRSNPYLYWEYLPSVVRKEFLFKIVLIGTESCGKSSLTKYLAKTFNTSWVEEYGRSYCINEMCGDESLLSYKDYGIIASNRNYEERECSLSANKILLCDTNAFITQYYCTLYEGSPHPLVDAYIEEEKYDLILHLDSDVKWVDDGLRINSDRTKTDKIFNKMLDDYNIKEHNGYNLIKGTYEERFDQAILLINKLIKGDTK